MNVDELLIREAIRDTIARYNHNGDRGKYPSMVECFLPDGELHIVGGAAHVGRAAMLEFFAGVSSTTTAPNELTVLRHCVTNTLIEVRSASDAGAQSYFQVITDIGLDHWGTYRDTFAPDAATGRWLIRQRSVKTDGYTPNSFFRT